MRLAYWQLPSRVAHLPENELMTGDSNDDSSADRMKNGMTVWRLKDMSHVSAIILYIKYCHEL